MPKDMGILETLLMKKESNKNFTRIIEKRIRKHARLEKLFRKNDKILVKGHLNRYFVLRIIKNLPCRIYFRKPKDTKANKTVVLWTLDDEINLFLKNIFSGKKMRKNVKEIKLLKTITDKEAERFAKIKKIRFVLNKKDRDVQHFIDKMTSYYPDTRYKLLKSAEILGKIKCIKKSF